MNDDAIADSSRWVNLETADIVGGATWLPASTSPVEDTQGFGLATSRPSYPNSTAIPLRLSSISSEYDGDVSDNPSFSSRLHSAHGSRAQGTVDISMSRAEDLSNFSNNHEPGSGASSRPRGSLLPADDGMGPLRKRIVQIQGMNIPADQKAHLMHELLSQGYTKAQKTAVIYHRPSQAHTKFTSQDKPIDSVSLTSYLWQMNGPGDGEATDDEKHVFHLSGKDLEKTYAPKEPIHLEDSTGDIGAESELGPPLGCQHYKRNVKLQCSTCERWYTCRMCHDEAEEHLLIRRATRYMLCMLCGCAQTAGEFCTKCGERSAWYYCDICKLWDNDPNKSIYHCTDCGICRKGRGLGKDFFHCKTCGTCMSMSVEHSHKCIERVSDCDCPICGDYMFTSPQPVVFMPCGHSIHYACYHEHMKTSYKCPICSKSAVNMELQFRNMDSAIESQPMPPQFQDTKAMVLCNDCHAKSAVMYHWLGLKCAICDSYNTAQLSILSDPSVDVPGPPARGTEQVPESLEAVLGEGLQNGPGVDYTRSRRHSLSGFASSPSLPIPGSLSPHPIPQRLGRSMSPPRGPGILDMNVTAGETDESEDERDNLDFWGIEELRSVTSAEVIPYDVEADDEDSGSEASDCDATDDEGDDDDEFDLFGHR